MEGAKSVLRLVPVRGRHDGLGIKHPQVEIVILCAWMPLNANKPSSKPYFREVTFVCKKI